jgi:hypothetical protein
MGKRRGDEDAEEGDGRDGEGGSDRAARKGRKLSLKATRRVARVLGVQFNEGDQGSDGGEEEEPFPGFPSRKAARKLSDSQREALVRCRVAGTGGAERCGDVRAFVRASVCSRFCTTGGSDDSYERTGRSALLQAGGQVWRKDWEGIPACLCRILHVSLHGGSAEAGQQAFWARDGRL